MARPVACLVVSCVRVDLPCLSQLSAASAERDAEAVALQASLAAATQRADDAVSLRVSVRRPSLSWPFSRPRPTPSSHLLPVLGFHP